MTKFDVKSALFGALLAAAITFSVAAGTGSRAAWEYKVISGTTHQDDLSKAINGWTAEGWEFVSASGPNNENLGMAVLRREKK